MTTAIPTPQPRHIPKRRRWIPDPKPEGGYYVRTEDETDTLAEYAGIDHVAEIRTALQRLTEVDELMIRLELRADRLSARLQDPALAADYPADHPLRIEAEDRLAAIDRQWNAALVNGLYWTALITSHGKCLLRDGKETELDVIGRALVHGWGPLGFAQRHSGQMHTFTWKRLEAASCPF